MGKIYFNKIDLTNLDERLKKGVVKYVKASLYESVMKQQRYFKNNGERI